MLDYVGGSEETRGREIQDATVRFAGKLPRYLVTWGERREEEEKQDSKLHMQFALSAPAPSIVQPST